MKGVENILVVQTAFIGDVILTTPLIRALKEGFPRALLSVLVIPATAEVLEGNPRIDEIIVYDKRGKERGAIDFLKLMARLRRQRFDLAIIPHRSLRSALLAYLARIPERVGFDTSAGSLLLTEKVAYRKGVHEVERNLDLARHLGLEVAGSVLEVFPGSGDHEFASRFLEQRGVCANDLLIGMSPGSVWATKRWLPERFARVADWLQEENGARVILFGGEGDRKLCQRIRGMMAEKPIIAAGLTSLRQSAALMARCRVFLSNDSAPVHLAVAMGVPVVAIFGATVPAFGFGPYGDGHVVIEKDLDCRPCGVHGGNVCPRGTFECMEAIGAAKVYEAVLGKAAMRIRTRGFGP